MSNADLIAAERRRAEWILKCADNDCLAADDQLRLLAQGVIALADALEAMTNENAEKALVIDLGESAYACQLHKDAEIARLLAVIKGVRYTADLTIRSIEHPEKILTESIAS